jgi:hypothetical protein
LMANGVIYAHNQSQVESGSIRWLYCTKSGRQVHVVTGGTTVTICFLHTGRPDTVSWPSCSAFSPSARPKRRSRTCSDQTVRGKGNGAVGRLGCRGAKPVLRTAAACRAAHDRAGRPYARSAGRTAADARGARAVRPDDRRTGRPRGHDGRYYGGHCTTKVWPTVRQGPVLRRLPGEGHAGVQP